MNITEYQRSMVSDISYTLNEIYDEHEKEIEDLEKIIDEQKDEIYKLKEEIEDLKKALDIQNEL